MRQYSVGEVVTWIPDLLLRCETHGDYRIVAAMPDQDGHHVYRIKSPREEYERVVKEDLLPNRMASCPSPKRFQHGCRAAAQSRCQLCNPRKVSASDPTKATSQNRLKLVNDSSLGTRHGREVRRRAAASGHPRGSALAPDGDGRYLLRWADGGR